MFFSADLLAKRDSGLGLLWLAATLGSKSIFKKLPKKSVVSADITQLCDLIAQPPEPLALRLSSSLMIGVARVYKVKQDIFYDDVNHTVASLKKVVQEMQAIVSSDLQMNQSTSRPSALTLNTNTNDIFDLDIFVSDWDEFLGLRNHEDSNADADFDPSQILGSKKPKSKKVLPPEEVRAEAVTLKENHEHLLSNSFDLSFSGSQGPFGPSSSQAGGIIDDFNFGPDDALDLAGFGDELARELGEGWGLPPTPQAAKTFSDMDLRPDVPMGGGIQGEFDLPNDFQPMDVVEDFGALGSQASAPSAIPVNGSDRALTPASQFSKMLLSQDDEIAAPIRDITPANGMQPPTMKKKNAKRTRILLDANTELSDEELKIARAQYLETQNALRIEQQTKNLEKENERMLEEIVWGVPSFIQEPMLASLWQENFKVQVESRTGALHLHIPGEPPSKRRKLDKAKKGSTIEVYRDQDAGHIANDLDFAEPPVIEHADFDPQFGGDQWDDPQRLRSSEEPGQARRESGPPSRLGDAFEIPGSLPDSLQLGSQRSSLFPWDNAGGPSSSSGVWDNAAVRIDKAEVTLRRNSFERKSRESSVVPSHGGSGVGLSPGFGGRSSQVIGEDYVFPEVNETGEPQGTLGESTQQSDLNLVTLERNSYNYLEYVKMQERALTSSEGALQFDVVVPKTTSTRHVAAAAFYHCLVLATKDLLRVKQEDAYGSISLFAL